jgi:hypothetical protein
MGLCLEASLRHAARAARVLSWPLLVASCGIDAAHPDRCGAAEACPEGRVCHDGFCVVSEDVVALDASVVTARDAGGDSAAPADAGTEPAEEPPDDGIADGDEGSLPEPACQSGVTCVGEQLAVCAEGEVAGAQTCPVSGDCRVARCEAGRGCVSATASDGAVCSGGQCEDGVCMAPVHEETCATSDCAPTCSAAEATCALSCAAASNCDPHCAAGTTCDVRCASASNCKVKCEGDCAIACEDTSNCRAECRAGGRCDVSCPAEGNCDEVRCRDGATCLLRCASSDDCKFKTCDGVETACSPTLRACNRACP